MPEVHPGQYPGLPLEVFLDQVAAPTPAPAGGSVAAVSTALAAALCSLAARRSPDLPGDAAAVRRAAEARRARALALASEDASAYGRVLHAQKVVAAIEGVEPALEVPLLGTALSAAADVPLELAGIAAEITAIAGELVAGGSLSLVGDSLTAALLAAAAAEAAAALVAINLGGGTEGKSDDRVRQAAVLATQAAADAAGAREAAKARLREP